jgi:CheY-like chemotaxis protein
MNGQPFILVVDDEPDFREIFSAKLSAAGYRVDTAENGQVALEKMAQKAPDLVLMDVKMPVMDGATAVLKMRDDPKLKNIKVAFLTSLGDPRMDMQDVSRKFSEEFGAQAYLKKTENLDMLVEQIQGLLA